MPIRKQAVYRLNRFTTSYQHVLVNEFNCNFTCFRIICIIILSKILISNETFICLLNKFKLAYSIYRPIYCACFLECFYAIICHLRITCFFFYVKIRQSSNDTYKGLMYDFVLTIVSYVLLV